MNQSRIQGVGSLGTEAPSLSKKMLPSAARILLFYKMCGGWQHFSDRLGASIPKGQSPPPLDP